MRRAAHASVSSQNKNNKRQSNSSAASSSTASGLHPDIEDSNDGGETDPLLDPENNNDEHQRDLPHRCAQESIFPLLHIIRQDVRSTIDTHLDWDELTSLDLNCKEKDWC
jgi:hypothetical protein